MRNHQINVLVLGVSGNVSQGIIQALRTSQFNINIVGACVFKDSIGQYMTDKFFLSPYANDKNFINWLINICNKEKIDLVLSGVEENIFEISKNIEKLTQKTNAKFIVAQEDILKIANNKLLTAKWLKENGCNYPIFADLSDDKEVENLISKISFPLIVKPKEGKGSKGIIIINKKEDLNSIKDKKLYVLEEYLGSKDDEYTVAVYMNKLGIFQSAIILKRTLQNGTTVLAEATENEAIYKECKKIAEKLKIKGPVNIQLRLHNNKPVCFEINARFSGTTPIRNLLGWRDLIASVDEYVFNNNDLAKYFKAKKGKVYRIMTPYLIKEAN